MERGRPSAGRPRILVVEDNDELRGLFVEALEEEGFAVLSAGDGAEALALIEREERCDALLLDDEMPRLRGVQLLSMLRARGIELPAVVCSGSLVLTPDERSKLGVTSALTKPVALPDLLSAVREAVRARASS